MHPHPPPPLPPTPAPSHHPEASAALRPAPPSPRPHTTPTSSKSAPPPTHLPASSGLNSISLQPSDFRCFTAATAFSTTWGQQHTGRRSTATATATESALPTRLRGDLVAPAFQGAEIARTVVEPLMPAWCQKCYQTAWPSKHSSPLLAPHGAVKLLHSALLLCKSFCP